MRKSIITSVLMLASCYVFGQDMSKLFGTQGFVWCGLDFSMVRCIGSEGFTDPQAIKEKYFDDWNNLVLTEADRYNFKDTYQKSNQTTDLSVVTRRNEMPDYKTFVINEPYSFEDGQLKKIISDYNLKDAKQGLGLVYVYETLNKTEQEAIVNLVFFDISTKEIIWTKRYDSPAGGFGFKNYWARTVLETMKTSEKDYKKALKTYEKSMK